MGIKTLCNIISVQLNFLKCETQFSVANAKDVNNIS
jgi:hypothetical protein